MKRLFAILLAGLCICFTATFATAYGGEPLKQSYDVFADSGLLSLTYEMVVHHESHVAAISQENIFVNTYANNIEINSGPISGGAERSFGETIVKWLTECPCFSCSEPDKGSNV